MMTEGNNTNEPARRRIFAVALKHFRKKFQKQKKSNKFKKKKMLYSDILDVFHKPW